MNTLSQSLKNLLKDKLPWFYEKYTARKSSKRAAQAKLNYNKKREQYKLKNLDIYDSTLGQEESNNLISERLLDDSPLMISRFGHTELKFVVQYLKSPGNYTETAIKNMHVLSGFFASVPEDLDRYSELFLESTQLIDILGIWYNSGEAEVIREFCPKASLVRLHNLTPHYHYHNNPWSQNLKAKKVLVIHPFADTIFQQYNNYRKYLFQDENFLPEFELMTLESVQSIAGIKIDFNSWFEAYDWMCNKIQEYDFEIAILGCGAYGLPLAAYIKSLGKKAIHLGGTTQLLFGIKGKRWDDHPLISTFYNEYWRRPKQQETPKDFKKVEGGCYW